MVNRKGCLACEIPAIKNVVQINRSLVTSKMFGFEGADVYEVIQNVSNMKNHTNPFTHQRIKASP